ncbi:DUF2947 domain-containing protein [Bacterioplanoides pacificum]|uniref:DUF2947 domain-containing protein n=1 Tax=Bacterioplanoides pacificum TaxID=1171596 RepID=A0ABV7VWL7_9GAMM
MNYIPLQDYKQGWIFRHREMPVDSADLAQIQPLASDSSQQFWRQHLSKEATHASHFLSDDWPSQNGVWLEKGEWQTLWESDHDELPELIAGHCQWDDNTTVFFCYDMQNIIQTKWQLFRRYWKNFLFYDDAVFLLGKKRDQVVRFDSDGSFEIGIKP